MKRVEANAEKENATVSSLSKIFALGAKTGKLTGQPQKCIELNCKNEPICQHSSETLHFLQSNL